MRPGHTATRAPARLDDASPARLRGRGSDGAGKELTPGAPGRRVASLLGRVDPVVLAIFAAGFAFSAYYTSQATHWIVMSDELQYAKLALGIGETLSPVPVMRGGYTGSLSQLYPLLTAPFWTLWGTTTAFELVHWANAAMMASTSIPAYLLARDVTHDRRAGYLVALLSVTVPWMAMGTMVLTEAAAYPAFVWALLGMQRSISAPSAGRDALALAGLGLAFLARTQFAFLALTYPLAIVAHEAGWSAAQAPGNRRRAAWDGTRAAVRRHRRLALLYALGALLALGLAATNMLGDLVGRYETTLHEGGLLPPGLAGSVAKHLAFVALAVGVLPFLLAAAWAVGSLVRPSTREGHAFAVLGIVTAVVLAVVVGSFTLRFTSGAAVHDRYFFYVVPLVFVGMAACLLDRQRRWKSILVAGAVLMLVMSRASFESYDLPFFASPDALFHLELARPAHDLGQAIGIEDLTLTRAGVVATGALAAIAAAIVHATRPATSLAAIGLAVLAFCVVETRYVFDRITSEIMPRSAATNPPAPAEGRDWVDGTLPAGESAAVLPAPFNSAVAGSTPVIDESLLQAMWLDTEFWNKSVQRAYTSGGFGAFAPFDMQEVAVDFATGRITVDDGPRHWVVSASDVRFRPRASTVKRVSWGAELIAPQHPYRASWATEGIGPYGWSAAGEPVRLRLYPDGRARRRSVSVTLESSPEIARPASYELRAGGVSRTGLVSPGAGKEVTLATCVSRDRARDVVLRIAGPTRLAEAQEIAGLRVTRITASGGGRTCR